MSLFLGVDVGGTRTVCAVGDGAAVLGRAQAGSCKLPQVTPARARRELHAAIRAACRQAAVRPRDVAGVCIGMAGVSNRQAANTLRALAAALVPAKIELVPDAVIALEAAFAGESGAVVIAGTGSIAYGRNREGKTARAGGWGPAVSDEGSGYWIGRAAVAAVLRGFDAHAAGDTPLPMRIMSAWRAKEPPELARAAARATAGGFAQLVPEVLAAAAEGDNAARDILSDAGAQLAALAHTVMRSLWPASQTARIAPCGGVFDHSALVRRVFENAVTAERPRAQVSREQVDPALGALALARRAATQAARAGNGS